MTYPHVPAAFINAIAEEGTKDEAIEYLQKQCNETCALRTALAWMEDHDPQLVQAAREKFIDAHQQTAATQKTEPK